MAALLIQYARQPGKARNPVTLETLIILPFVLIKCGTANAVNWYTERTFILKTLKIHFIHFQHVHKIVSFINTFQYACIEDVA